MFIFLVCIASACSSKYADQELVIEEIKLNELETLLEETFKDVEQSADNFGSVSRLENHKNQLKKLIEKADETIQEYSKSEMPSGNLTIIPLKVVKTKVSDYNQDLLTSDDITRHNTTIIFGTRGSLKFVPIMSKVQTADGFVFAPTEASPCLLNDFDLVFYLGDEKQLKASYVHTPSNTVRIVALGKRITFDAVKLKAKSSSGNADTICIGKFDLYKTD